MRPGDHTVWFVPNTPYALSGRRIYEHARHRQRNPFAVSLPEIAGAHEADAVIDLLVRCGEEVKLTGLTVADLSNRALSRSVLGAAALPLLLQVRRGSVQRARAFVLDLVRKYAQRVATRNAPPTFLPPELPSDVFGVRCLRSGLCDYLERNSGVRRRPGQWQATLRNLSAQGLRKEELGRSGLEAWLSRRDPSVSIDGAALRAAVDFSALRISIVPYVDETREQLRFEPSGARNLPPAKGRETRQTGQRRELRQFDAILGYRVEAVERESLWGTDRYWQALTWKGAVLPDPRSGRLYNDSELAAMATASEHARERYPKLRVSGDWSTRAWSGGEDYREWLITLPHFAWSHRGWHFPLRNVLAHVRCDVRMAASGERTLLLQEVQSDWLQQMRRMLPQGADPMVVDRTAPFLREWHALAFKLMLLHAAASGHDAIAWLRGSHQVERYGGRGRAGLKMLYDKDLTEAADRIAKGFGLVRGSVKIPVPRNFSIRCLDGRYYVLDGNERTLGSACTQAEARRLIPEDALEDLRSVHAIRLSSADRARILAVGLPAWG